MIIQFEKVNKWYGKYQALRDVDLSVQRGERLVICGPSGSGKSTLIRCINGLEEHESGRIVVDDIEITKNRKRLHEIRQEVGMVFQQFNLFPNLTALGNVMLAQQIVRESARARKKLKATARQLLAKVGIPEKADVFPAERFRRAAAACGDCPCAVR